MNRIYLYSTAFAITLAIFILSGASESLDGLVFLSFLVSSVLFVFAKEELPKAKLMKSLEVRQYHERRINIYGYAMSAILMGCSLLFAILSIYLKLRSGIVSLIIWIILILSFYYGTKIIGDKVYYDNLLNYMTSYINLTKSDLLIVIKFIESKFAEGLSDKEILKELENEFAQRIRIPLLHETLDLYIEYKLAESNIVSPDEISDMNK